MEQAPDGCRRGFRVENLGAMPGRLFPVPPQGVGTRASQLYGWRMTVEEKPMDTKAIQVVLSASQLARGLDADALESLATIATTRDFQPNQLVVAAGDPCDGLYVVASGEARVESEFGGTTRTVATLKPVDLFGEVALVGHQARSSSVYAVQPLTCVILPAEPLYKLMEENDGVRERLEEMAQARLEANLTKHLEEG